MSTWGREKVNAECNRFMRVPLSVTAERLGGKALIAYGQIFSASKRAGNPLASCRASYTDFTENGCGTRSTVRKSLKRLIDGGLVVQLKHCRTSAEYIARDIDADAPFLHVENFLYQSPFFIKSEDRTRRLRPYEWGFIARVATHDKGERERRERERQETGARPAHEYYSVSIATLCALYGVRERTMRHGIAVALKTRLIHSADRIRRAPADKPLRFYADEKLLGRMKRRTTPETGARAERQGVQAADQRAEREAFYAARRQLAEDLADRKRAEAETKSPELARVGAELRRLAFPMARAEVQGDKETYAALKGKETALRGRHAAILARLGLREEDLRPRWHCPLCEDTGYKKDGHACDCYGPPQGGGRR